MRQDPNEGRRALVSFGCNNPRFTGKGGPEPSLLLVYRSHTWTGAAIGERTGQAEVEEGTGRVSVSGPVDGRVAGEWDGTVK